MTRKLIISAILTSLLFVIFVPNISAKDKEYEAIAKNLQSKFQAKKVKIPFMWLARFAVKIVKPAGVKSFNVTMFEDLSFSRETLDEEMQAAVSDSLGKDWLPILRVRSREGDQVYAYMRENGKDIKMMLVTINQGEAALIRATFNPDKLADFINNPRIFGVSLGDNDKTAQLKNSPPDSNDSK